MPDWSFDPAFVLTWALMLALFCALPLAIAAVLGMSKQADRDADAAFREWVARQPPHVVARFDQARAADDRRR